LNREENEDIIGIHDEAEYVVKKSSTPLNAAAKVPA